MPAPVLQFKRGNAGVAGTVPALRPGEPAISLNNFDFFIGTDTSVANNKFFGSHRYWTRENGTTSLKLNLVDKNGSNSISVKSPDTLVGSGTYTLPDPNTIIDGYFLRVAAGGVLSWSNDLDASGSTLTNSSLSGITTITGYVNATGSQINAGIVTVTDLYLDTTRVLYNDGLGITIAGIQTIDATTKNTLETILAFAPNNFDSLNVTGIATIGTGVGITQFSNSVSTGNSTSSVPTSSAVINYVQSEFNAVTIGVDADTGGPTTITLADTVLSINGTANEIETNVNGPAGSIVTIGLPNTVIVGTSLSAPTVKVATIQHSGGTQAATIDGSGNITASQNLTVTGDLYVNGSTTQVNTASMTVEDRTIELGIVDGSAPSSATTWDLGVLFNYYTDSAKKSALVWEQGDARFKLGSVVADGGGTGNSNPQLTVSTFAPIEIAELWVNNTCTGGAQQVIGCVGAELQLQNIVVDAGLF